MNNYFSDQLNEEVQAVEDIVVFADEAISNNRKKMMSLWPTSMKRQNASNWTSSSFFCFFYETFQNLTW